MGQFAVVISGVGGHGCSRDVKDGESVLGCQRPDCPDCIAREFVRRYKRNNVSELRAELVHWPTYLPYEPKESPEDIDVLDLDATISNGVQIVARFALVMPSGTTVTDDLVTGIRHGSF